MTNIKNAPQSGGPSFTVTLKATTSTIAYIEVGFNPNAPADNDQHVIAADVQANEIAKSVHGKVVLVSGRASLPVAFVLAHAFGHVAKAVAVYDPKMERFVVSVAHGSEYRIGDTIKFTLSDDE